MPQLTWHRRWRAVASMAPARRCWCGRWPGSVSPPPGHLGPVSPTAHSSTHAGPCSHSLPLSRLGRHAYFHSFSYSLSSLPAAFPPHGLYFLASFFFCSTQGPSPHGHQRPKPPSYWAAGHPSSSPSAPLAHCSPLPHPPLTAAGWPPSAHCSQPAWHSHSLAVHGPFTLLIKSPQLHLCLTSTSSLLPLMSSITALHGSFTPNSHLSLSLSLSLFLSHNIYLPFLPASFSLLAHCPSSLPFSSSHTLPASTHTLTSLHTSHPCTTSSP